MSETPSNPLPPGEYCIVEIMGHSTLVGRYEEVERFGTKMLAIEPLFRDTMLPVIFHGGQSIYRLIPCSADIAWAKQAREAYQLPTAIRCIVPPLLLEAPSGATTVEVYDDSTGDVGDEENSF